MKALIQRVISSQVAIGGQDVASIGAGLLVLLGVEEKDTLEDVNRLSRKLIGYRVFADQSDRMNLSVLDVTGDLLIVSQFTLVADTKKGLRPSLAKGASPQKGEQLYNAFVDACCQHYEHFASEQGISVNVSEKVQTGRFGADMQVSLINDGPVTFMLET